MRRLLHKWLERSLRLCLFLLACFSPSHAAAPASYPSQPLRPEKAQVALIFIGGFADNITGIVAQLSQQCPPLDPQRVETRAYYHWDEGLEKGEAWPYMQAVSQDILTFRQHNPQATLVLIGHSYGAVAALELAALLPPSSAPLYLISLDPVDLRSTRKRPPTLTWWGHTYVRNSPSSRDLIFQTAGRWGDAPQADLSQAADGSLPNEFGHRIIHDYAYDLLLSRGTNPHSLWQALQTLF